VIEIGTDRTLRTEGRAWVLATLLPLVDYFCVDIDDSVDKIYEFHVKITSLNVRVFRSDFE